MDPITLRQQKNDDTDKYLKKYKIIIVTDLLKQTKGMPQQQDT